MQPGDEAVVDIGHVHLKVSDLERAIGFYRDLVGMTLKNTHEWAPSSPSATTTIISASTLGAAGVVGRPPQRRLASSTSRSATRIEDQVSINMQRRVGGAPERRNDW
jgi:predicted enzyme related to lactoylglutathione lyase